MEFINYGIRFIFRKDYITKSRHYKKGTKCNTLNGVVVLGNDMEFLFDIDSELGRHYGEIIN